MANTKTPVNSTYQTKQLNLFKQMNNRGNNNTTDELYVNIITEIIQDKNLGQKEVNLIKREGSGLLSTIAAGPLRGAYHWKDQNKIYIAKNTDIFVYTAGTGVYLTTLAGVFATTSGPVGFSEFEYSTTQVKLVVTDGTTTGFCTIDSSNVVVHNADMDLPTHVPQPVVLDGYVFVLKADSADVYNSVNDNPLSWDASNYISAEMRADKAQAIALLNNYLVVFGNKSIEYFYDAANVSGSPLSRNDTPMKQVGYLGGISQLGNKIYFLGEEVESEPNIYVLEDFKITPLATDGMRRTITALTAVFSLGVYGNIVSINGHNFYVITIGSHTWAMEVDDLVWSKWAYKQTDNFPIVFSAQTYSSVGYRNIFLLSTEETGYFWFSSILTNDVSNDFSCIIVTENEYFDSYNHKDINELRIFCDNPRTTAYMTIQWTDDDYQTYNTGQTINLNQELPCIRRCGKFRRRAHKFTYTASAPLRIFAVEVKINLGNT